MRRPSFLVFVVVTALLWLPTADSAAQRTFVKCGDPVPASIVVANSLFDCPGSGLVITNSNVTLNLGGNTIDGDAIASDSEAGVTSGADLSGIKVINGIITDFQYGVSMPDTSNVTLKNLVVSDNTADGIDLTSGANHVIRNVTARRSGQSGFDLFGGSNYEVSRSHAFDNVFGFTLGGSSSNYLVTDSTATHNTDYGFFLEGGTGHTLDRVRAMDNESEGIHFHGTKHILMRSLVSGNDGDGMDVASGTNRIERTTISNNEGSGINILEGDRTVIKGVKAYGNRLNGITIDDFAGIPAVSKNHRVIGSWTYGNGSSGIYLGDGQDYVVSETSSHGNRFEGVFLQNGSGHRVTDTTVRENGEDGVEVNSGDSYVLKRIVANRNGFANGLANQANFGIKVLVASALTAAANKAAGNDVADPAVQCSAAANCN